MTSKRLTKHLSSMKIREYDEKNMPKEDLDAVKSFTPPIIFRWLAGIDEEEFNLQVSYLINKNEEGALYTPWTEVPAYALEYMTMEKDGYDGNMH